MFFYTFVINVLLFISLSFSLSWADGTSVIPYSGTLYSQGKPVSQGNAIKMAFALYEEISALPNLTASSDANLTSSVPHTGRKWTSWATSVGVDAVISSTDEDTVDVYVRHGRFLAHLGDEGQIGLSNSIFDSNSLYVVVWIVQEISSNEYKYHRLPPQKLNTVPHAVTASRALSFEVADTLTVGGDLNVQGALNVAETSTLDDHLVVSGTSSLNDGATLGSRTHYLPTAPLNSTTNERNEELRVVPREQNDEIRIGYYPSPGIKVSFVTESNGSFSWWMRNPNLHNNAWQNPIRYYPEENVVLLRKTHLTPNIREEIPNLEAISTGQLGRLVTASCRSNEIVISGGCFQEARTPGLVLHGSHTQVGLNRHTCTYSNYSAGNTNVRAFATCLRKY